jgi:peptide/nickel transport system permease protein
MSIKADFGIETPGTSAVATPVSRSTPWNGLLSELGRAPLGIQCCLAVVAGFAGLALLAPVLAPFGEASVLGDSYAAWGTRARDINGGSIGTHWLGTDQMGRDMLSRLLFGLRTTLEMALAATLLAALIAAPLGILAAFRRGWIEQALLGFMHMLTIVPTLIVALLVLAISGPSAAIMIAVLAAGSVPDLFRTMHMATTSVLSAGYTDAARLRGETAFWIIQHDVLPNVARTAAAAVLRAGCVITLVFTTVSFLGMAMPSPVAELAAMVRENATLLTYGVMTPLLPACAIALFVLALGTIANWVARDLSGSHHGR